MTTQLIEKTVMHLADMLKQEYNHFEFRSQYHEIIQYKAEDLGRFIDHLIEKAQNIKLTLLKNHIGLEDFEKFIIESHFPILVFYRKSPTEFEPLLIHNDHRNTIHCRNLNNDQEISAAQLDGMISKLAIYENAPDLSMNGKLIFITAFPMRYILKDTYNKEAGEKEKLTPAKRLFRLLRADRKDILYIYTYAIIVGIVNLSLPLGIQATISLISGGMVFSSVIVLISLVILGILVGGGLQIMQITLVEVLQQRIFAKASFELSFRISKVQMEALFKYYPPELMNRFFDVVTIQKGLPKLFVDITGALVQIFFGLLLLSLYHPFFLIFAIILVGVVTAVFYVTGPRGLKTSIIESKYKYKIAHWLEELALTVDAFKMAGNTNLPLQRMDELLNGYLHYRKSHFRVLLTQFANIVAFKTIVTGGLLILGTILVVDRQISLGQFVASEVIIILVVGSVEKLVLSIDVIYDLLTAVDKVAAITDLPTERNDGLHVALETYPQGLHIRTKDLKYKYHENDDYTLKGLDLEVQPGENICIAGANDSGKHTLMRVLTGVLEDYEGVVTMNHLSLRDINLSSFRDKTSKNLYHNEIFYGTILDNITMGRSQITYQDVLWAIENLEMGDAINAMPEGLHTMIGNSGKVLSGGILSKLLLARAVVSRPKLLIVSDFSEHISRKDKQKILTFLQRKDNGWTLLILSIADDPVLFSACDKVILLKKGKILAQGSYEKLLENKEFQSLVFKGKETTGIITEKKQSS